MEVDFWKCLKICFNFSFCTRSFARHFRNVPKCRFGWKVGMRGACGRYGTEGFRVRLVGGRAPLRRFAPCVLRWKTLRVSSAPHPCGFESLRMPTKKRSRFIRAWSAMFFGAGTEGFEPPTAGTKNRSSTVELRPSMGVAKSNSSSLPNLRGHRKRHRAGVRRVSAHHLR